MSKKARVFVPLTKVDEEQRLVYGRITQEVLDKANEVMDYDSSKPNFEAWSNEIETASGGLSKGNVRVMHGLSVAGKLTDLNFDDTDKAIDVCAKVVDDGEWEKVKEGCYTGFSVGGSYAKRWTEDDGKGNKIKKFTAKPNEVSLVDNPCVPSATFSLVKADGAEEVVPFKVENDDDAWPAFAKADASEESTEDTSTVSNYVPTNDEVVAKAEEMAKAANDGSTWMQHVEPARDLLVKEATNSGKVQKETEEGGDAKAEGEDKGEAENDADQSDDETAGDETDDKSTKVTPAGVKQGWTASDGTFFEKKDEAVAHEATLNKGEPTEADKLKARLDKALKPEEVVEDDLLADPDRMAKVIQVLETPFENGEPKLEKGMYRVSRFADLLASFSNLAKSIHSEGVREKDESDKSIANEMKKAITDLSTSFKTYTENQVTELIAGISDDDLTVCYDYYAAAVEKDESNQLAKDVCSVLNDYKDVSRERRDVLAKAFVSEDSADTDVSDELSPPMKKRFDELEEENKTFKKIAEDAVAAVETLTKRVETIENEPAPRAPKNVMFRDGDQYQLMGKTFTNQDDLRNHLHDMIKTQGPDAVALEMIKAAHASGGQRLTMKQ